MNPDHDFPQDVLLSDRMCYLTKLYQAIELVPRARGSSEMRLIAALVFCSATLINGAAVAQTAAEEQACKADFKKYCSGVMPGGGRVIACLQKQIDKLSPDCQKVVKTYAK